MCDELTDKEEIDIIAECAEKATAEAHKRAFQYSDNGTLLSVHNGYLVSIDKDGKIVKTHKKL
jgi:hypothetical protein